MTGTDATDAIGTDPVDDLLAPQRNASDLKREADAATQTYDRTAWSWDEVIRVPIPSVVCFSGSTWSPGTISSQARSNFRSQPHRLVC